jgi:hypothetical protein
MPYLVKNMNVSFGEISHSGSKNIFHAEEHGYRKN